MAARNPRPNALRGWPRSHLRSSPLAMQRLAGRSTCSHFHCVCRSSIHDPVHTAWQRRRRWCVQRAIRVRAAALTQHGTRCWASVAHTRTRWWFLAERAYSRTAQVARRGGELGRIAVRSPSAPPGRCRARPRLSTTTQSYQPPPTRASSIGAPRCWLGTTPHECPSERYTTAPGAVQRRH